MADPAQSKRASSSLLRRSFKKILPTAVRGEGVYLWDSEGKRYLDFSGSAAVNFVGHGVREITAAMTEQAGGLEFVHSSQFTSGVAEEYARELIEFAGAAFRGGAVFFTSGGSEAVETALKLARQYQVEVGQTKRFRVLSRKQSYHGATLGAVAVSGNRRRREIYLPMLRDDTDAHKINTPYCYRCVYGCRNCAAAYAEELERAIHDVEGEAAAFIFEPVSGATLGAAVPPSGYLQRVAEICRREGVLLIADEVMTGMGRTGKNFAVEHWDVAPDIIVAAKGLSSGYAPLGAVIVGKKIEDAIARGSGSLLHGFTYNAHPIAMAAGRAVLSFIKQRQLVSAADSAVTAGVAGRLRDGLEQLRSHGCVGDVRGIGLLWGIEFVTNKNTKQPIPPDLNFAGRVSEAAVRRGLLVYPMQGCADGTQGDHLLIAPPAVITREQVERSCEQLRESIDETLLSPPPRN
ncbi:MAG TPA: aspartate aminotransferase family protein [Terriglobales bacterium]|nr:aspartate aminotransferase family protein [Terriglobales bacterium]